MRLNGDIVFDFLSQSVQLERYGNSVAALELRRPLFYDGTATEFNQHQLYIAFCDQLPEYPAFGLGTVIICVGGIPRPAYITGSCCCMVVRRGTDLFSVFNLTQLIFDRFDAWESDILRILGTTSSVQELLDVSYPIFENPMAVIGADYYFLGYSKIIDAREDLSIFRPDKDNKIKPDILSASIYDGDTDMHMQRPFYLDMSGYKTFSMNLFEHGIYIGNIKIAFILRPYRKSDNILSQYLSKAVEQAIPNLTELTHSNAGVLRDSFKKLLAGIPLSAPQRQFLSVNSSGTYVCLKLIRGERSKRKVPISYISDHIESSFPGSVVFEYESAMVALLNIKALGAEEKNLNQNIKALLREMNLKAGMSNRFSDLPEIRAYFRQANIALELGSPLYPQYSYFCFNDYILTYMMYSCMGEFAQETLYPEGFKKLAEYDGAAQADYIETLQVYLNNNMNVAQSARELYIHRSTFMERLRRIETLLDMDLNDPDQRLCLSVILKIGAIRRREKEYAQAAPPKEQAQSVSDAHYTYQELDKLL